MKKYISPDIIEYYLDPEGAICATVGVDDDFADPEGPGTLE